jgi:ATP-binding cassette subfamily B protein
MKDTVHAFGWPAARLGEALGALADRARLGGPGGTAAAAPPRPPEGAPDLGPWIEAAAGWRGIEAEPVEAAYPGVGAMVRTAGPALLRLPGGTGPCFLALLAGRGACVTLLTPELRPVEVPAEAVRAALCRDAAAAHSDEVERILAEAGVRKHRAGRARSALLRELLAAHRVGGCWLLRPAGTAPFTTQAREARLPRLLALLLVAHLAGYGLLVASWWLLGAIALGGRLDRGWLAAWLLLLLTLIPFRLLVTTAGGRLSIRAGALLKRRLLGGALRLEPDEIRHLGAGQLLGRVLESGVIEQAALTGGFLGLTAALELVVAGAVLASGAGGPTHALLLLGTAAAALLLGARYYRRRRRWTDERLDLTNGLVERMIGHRTRLAQEPGARRHDGDDHALARYLDGSRDLDRSAALLQAVVPRGWLIVGLLGLAPAFVTGSGSPAALAVGLGGVLLAQRALRNLVDGLERLAGAALAWNRVRPLWQAAARPEPAGHPGLMAPPPAAGPGRNGRPLLEACDVAFRHPGRAEPVLRGVALQVRAGDRLLLEGPSGGGKSTLAGLLSGSRVPAGGLLLLDGLDRATLGAAGWRRRVVLAPQFHENHVLMGTFAFNALMGRGWPPRPGDVAEAERVCRALGLGPLLERMPAGMLQQVGETGWQLSHGEKSRLFIARALLQGADLVLLDESFAALDPETLRRTLGYVLEQAPTVLVIAHP